MLVADAFYELDLAGKVMRFVNDAAPAEPLSWLATSARLSAPRPADATGQLRRSRPAHARRQRHQTHDHLGTPLTTGSNCERRTGRSCDMRSHALSEYVEGGQRMLMT